MSVASSPSRSSFGEQTIFAVQDLFILPSDVTAGRTSAADSFHYDYTFASGNGSPYYTRAVNTELALNSPANNASIEAIEDDRDEQSSETYSRALHQLSDRDWLVFNNSSEALPIIHSDFFEDADACVPSPTTSYKSGIDTEEADEGICLDDAYSYDLTEHIDEALNDFEIRSQDDYIPEEFLESIEQETLLLHWQYDYQRHEWVALKFHQPPYITEPYSVPYTTEHQ